jgi:hypothetical protein
VTVVDDRHPLYCRSFPVVSEHRTPGKPRSFEVEHRDGIILRIPAAATTGSGYCPALAPRRHFQPPSTIVSQILKTYNKDSPYVPLSRWEGTLCEGCGTTVDDDDLVSCEVCYSEGCSECSSSCPGCSRCLCSDCRSHCAACGDISCSSCLKTCPDCSDDHCSHCRREDDLCETCRNAREEEEETDAEAVAAR